MTLKDDLSFIVGAVARKEYEPGLCHLLIRDGKAIAYDGLLSMSTPIEMAHHIKPHVKDLMTAIKAIEGDPSPVATNVTGTGRLSIKCGKFKAFVSCLDNEDEMIRPMSEGPDVMITPEMFKTLEILEPYMGIDASRPWAMGIAISKMSALVTNNVILIERWHGSNFPHEIILPAATVRELLRIGKIPVRMQVTENSATFHYEGDRWLRIALIDGQWPVDRVQERFSRPANPKPLPKDFFDALTKIKPFIQESNHVYIKGGKITSHDEDGDGAEIEVDIEGEGQIFSHMHLSSLEDLFEVIDLDSWPEPCFFLNKSLKLRGVIIGVIRPGV